MATSQASERLDMRPFPGTGDPTYLLPRMTEDVAPYWEALRGGRLLLQECLSCGKRRHPVAPICPYCLSDRFIWQQVAPSGSIFSWIRYHRSYLPEFEQLMPYSVLTVQLDAGPRMFGRFASDVDPEIGARVRAIGEEWPDGHIVPAFIPEPTRA